MERGLFGSAEISDPLETFSSSEPLYSGPNFPIRRSFSLLMGYCGLRGRIVNTNLYEINRSTRVTIDKYIFLSDLLVPGNNSIRRYEVLLTEIKVQHGLMVRSLHFSIFTATRLDERTTTTDDQTPFTAIFIDGGFRFGRNGSWSFTKRINLV